MNFPGDFTFFKESMLDMPSAVKRSQSEGDIEGGLSIPEIECEVGRSCVSLGSTPPSISPTSPSVPIPYAGNNNLSHEILDISPLSPSFLRLQEYKLRGRKIKKKIPNNLKTRYGKIVKRIDNFKIYSHGIGLYSSLEFIGNIDWSTKQQARAGIIPYIISPDTHDVLLCLGLDSTYSNMTDFGGGVKKTDATCYDAALREFDEETLGVFELTREKVPDYSLVLYNETMMIIFVKIESEINIEEVHERFNMNKIGMEWIEISELIWMNKEYMREIIMGGDVDVNLKRGVSSTKEYQLYSRVQNLMWTSFITHGDYTKYLV